MDVLANENPAGIGTGSDNSDALEKPELRLPVPMVAVRTRRKLLNQKTRLMTSLLNDKQDEGGTGLI